MKKYAVLMSLFILTLMLGCSSKQDNYGETPSTPFDVNIGTIPSWESGREGYFDVSEFVSGGIQSYYCELAPGSELPNGIELDEFCFLSGTITLSPGTTKSVSPPFTVIVKDSSEPPKLKEMQLSITTVMEPPYITTNSKFCIVNEQCNVKVAEIIDGYGEPPYTFYLSSYAYGTLPAGISLNSDGRLSGTAMKAGEYSFKVCVSDSLASISCSSVDLTVYEKGMAPVIKEYSVNAQKIGVGVGTLTFDESDEICPPDCSDSFEESSYVTLIAKWDSNAWFGGWTGCDDTYDEYDMNMSKCFLTMDSDKDVKAEIYSYPEIDIISKKCQFLSYGIAYPGERIYGAYKISASGRAIGGTEGSKFSMQTFTIGSTDYSTEYEEESLSCGNWKIVIDDSSGYKDYYCVRQAGQPETTEWSYELRFEPNGNMRPYHIKALLFENEEKYGPFAVIEEDAGCEDFS